MRTFRFITGSALAAWAAALAVSAGPAQGSTAQATTNSGIYTKAQADGAKAQYDKVCAECHAFTVAAKKKPKDLPLGDEPFFETWDGRPVADLINVIHLTMPNDGSAVLSEKEAVDLTAYILQQNGFRPGSKPLTKETATAVVERPKK
jgi:mono/diheme cytochrome c family protein